MTTCEETAGARFASWWAAAITRTAGRGAGLDRREEIASDVHEQLTEALSRGDLFRGSRSVLSRVVRGVPADIAWRVGLELSPTRSAWHLRNPSTAITTLFVVMFPVTMVADSSGRRSSQLVDYRIPLWILTDAVGCCVLLFASLALMARLRQRWMTGAARFVARSRLERLRRCATAVLGVAWAGSSVFRFGAVSSIGAGFWGAFGLCLLGYLLLLVLTLGSRILTLGSYLPKVTL